MTAQILKKDSMRKSLNDPAFMVRWLNGTLSDEEISTLRNKEEYQEMLALQKDDPIPLSPEKSRVGRGKKNNANRSRAGSVGETTSFPTFTVIAVVLIAAVIIYWTLSS